MKILRNAALGLAVLSACELASPEAKAITVSFSNLNTAVSSSNVWVMFGGASQGTLSGTLTYSGSSQSLTFGQTYQLSQIANQTVNLQAGTSGKIFILYSGSGTEFNGSNGTPSYNYGQNTPSVGARWDKIEFSQYTGTTSSSGFNMSAADFFSIPLTIQTYNSGSLVATSGWHPPTSTATVFQNLSALIATGSAQPYAIVQSTTTSGTAYSIPVTVSGTTLNVLRIINPQQVPLTVVGTNNPLPNPYASFVPYITFTATSGNKTSLQGTYGGVTGQTALPANCYVTQDYYFTSTVTTAGDLIITGSTVANINTGSTTLPANPQTIRIASADLPQGIYTAAPPYTIDGISGTQAGSNSVYDQVISDLLAGFNLGLVGSTVVDPRLSTSGTLNNIPAGTKLGAESSAAWFSTGPQYGLNPMLSASQAFSTAQPGNTFYNEYAQYVSSVSDAYSFPYTDKTSAPLLTTTPGVADTIVISILSDTQPVAGLQSARPRAIDKPVRFFGTTSSNLRIQGQPRMPYSKIKVHLEIDHAKISDLVVRLHSPAGQSFVLHRQTGANGDKLVFAGVPIASTKEVKPNGLWRLVIDDTKRKNNGTLVSWGLEFPVQP